MPGLRLGPCPSREIPLHRLPCRLASDRILLPFPEPDGGQVQFDVSGWGLLFCDRPVLLPCINRLPEDNPKPEIQCRLRGGEILCQETGRRNGVFRVVSGSGCCASCSASLDPQVVPRVQPGRGYSQGSRRLSRSRVAKGYPVPCEAYPIPGDSFGRGKGN